MKIAVIHTSFVSRGGGERFLYEVFTRLKKFHEVRFFCNGVNPETFDIGKFDYTVIPSRHDLFGKFVAYYEAEAVKKTIESAAKWIPNLVWLNIGYYYTNLIRKKYGLKVIPYVHYPIFIGEGKQSWLRNFYRRIIGLEALQSESFADTPIVLCNSRYIESAIKRIQPSANVQVIYPGMDHEKFYPTWEDEGFLYYNSRFQPNKNQMLALDVAEKTGYDLILSGFVNAANLNYFKRVEKRASELGVKILRNPSDPTIVQLLQKCSVFLFPSIGEHFGIAPIEAMACGKAVIAHNSGGPVETVGEAGILCGNNLEDWVKATKDLMGNEGKRRAVGKKASEFSMQFTWDNTVEQIKHVFKGIGFMD